jgi:integrase
MLKQGVYRKKIVQERLGHSTIVTTLDIYSYVSHGSQEAAACQLDEDFEHEVRQKNIGKMLVKLP